MVVIIEPFSLCLQVEKEITDQCKKDNVWQNAMNYGCNKHFELDKGFIQILPDYERYFDKYKNQKGIEFKENLPNEWQQNIINH